MDETVKGAFLYVDAGKGHYVPAVALADSFKRAGYEAIVDNLFTAVYAPFWRGFCKYEWRFCLHHPRFEMALDRFSDGKTISRFIKGQTSWFNRLDYFKDWYELEKPDFIVSTNFIGGIILPVALKKIGVNCPVLQYAADVFDCPQAGINNSLYRMYVPSEYGMQKTLKRGQSKETTKLCPFPLSTAFTHCMLLSKKDARLKLGLKDKFTILISLGGEGIGDVHILKGLAARGLDVQAIVIGGKSKTTTRQLNDFMKKYPDFDLVRPGFVDNVYDYLMACDLQVGKAGANALMEAMYIQRPSLISEVLYMASEVKGFFKEYPVGWCEDNMEKKLDIIQKCYEEPSILEEVDELFKTLPLKFSADDFREQIIEDVKDFYKSGQTEEEKERVFN